MGMLDRLKNKQAGDGASGERAPTNFDELQDAAEAAGRGGVEAVDSRLDDLAEVAEVTQNASLAPMADAPSIISELPPSEELSDFADTRLPPAAGVSRSIGVLLTARSAEGTVSVNCHGCLNSGSSQQGKQRRASVASNCVAASQRQLPSAPL